MTKDTIRDFHGRIIGYIETDDNGNKTIKNFYGKILGYYQKSDNTTRNFYRKIIARGDQSSALFYTEK